MINQPQHVGTCGRFYLTDASTGAVSRCAKPAGHAHPLDHGPADVTSFVVNEGTCEAMAEAAAGRHPGTVHLMRLFAWAHLPSHLQVVSAPFGRLAIELLARLNDGPELTTALRKLREAKDCAVTQLVEDLAG